MKTITDEAIRDAVGKHTGDIVEWTKQLIRFPSDNRPPKGQEADVQRFIARECRGEGLAVDVFAPDEVSGIEDHPAWLNGREYDQDRANVVATWSGGGREGRCFSVDIPMSHRLSPMTGTYAARTSRSKRAAGCTGGGPRI